MEIIVWGTGHIAQETYPYINKEYNILWYVDSDSSKWGKRIGDYEIKEPKSVLEKDVNVIVISINYEMEIVDQLLEMGIGIDRIYLCNSMVSEEKKMVDIYPFDNKKLEIVNKPLIEYDLKAQKEYLTDKSKVMIFASFYSVYTKQLIEKMLSRYEDVEVSLITYSKESEYLIDTKQVKHIYVFRSMSELKNILEQLPKYDIAQFLWMENRWAYFQDILREKFRRINLCVGGSDFYRASNKNREYKREFIYSADCIIVETEVTVQNFKEYYGDGLNIKVLPYGIEVLEYIKEYSDKSIDKIKDKFGIPRNKVVVTCGHNANPQHQHLELIRKIIQLDDKIKENAVFVFPMTYPGGMQKHINDVRKELEKNNLNFVILTEFMNFKDMAEYALLSDVMIHVQTTDQLSSTMLEEMYAQSVVIAGKWLPYDSLHKKGIYFLDVDDMDEIPNVLGDVINNLEEYREKCKINRDLIWNHSSWDLLIEKWHEMWV